MEQVTQQTSYEASDGRNRQRFPNRKFGNRIPNRFQTINPSENLIYNQLSAAGGLNINLGADVSFYVNKLSYGQFQEVLNSLPDPNAKKKVNRLQKFDKPINWVSTISYSDRGKRPCEPIEDSIAIYQSMDIDSDAKRIISYGYADLTFDFSRLNLLQAQDGYPEYPFGIIFFSDLRNEYNDYNAVISCIPERRNTAAGCSFIHPIDISRQGPVHCDGKFRQYGNFIIFYVDNEIEKREGIYYPDITVISIPVSVFRDHKQGHIIKETGICSLKKGSICISDIIEYLIREIFVFYGVSNNQFIGEVIHAFGYDPVKYNYPPSLGDERSRYYGGNTAHVGTKSNGFRKETPFRKGNNLFNYLDEITKKDNTFVVTTSTKENKEKPKVQPEHSEHEEPVYGEDVPVTVESHEGTPPKEEYSQSEIDAALTDDEPIPEEQAEPEEEEMIEDEPPEEEPDPDYKPEENTHSNEESPQGEEDISEEVVGDDNS
jgi:hypothetical protein